MGKTKAEIQDGLTEEEKKELEEKKKAAHREAQRRYREKKGKAKDKELYKNRTLTLKKEEDEKINEYCRKNNIQRNALIRKATMEYIGKYI